MRYPRVAICLLEIACVSFAQTSGTQRRVTVVQFEETVKHAKAQGDGEAAKEIEHLRLTERLSSPKLSVLTGELRGKKSRAALIAVSDASAFLNPPASELPEKAAPDPAEQQRILSLAIEYLDKINPRLPDFSARRITTSFEEVWTPRNNGDRDRSGVLHSVGTSEAMVYYHNGQEIVREAGAQEHGLATRGTFGPILHKVFRDATNSATMKWCRWEEGPTGPMAVYTFQVSQLESHYAISVSGEPGTINAVAYHGEVGIDPSSGVILRLVLEGDPGSSASMRRADVMVEYGSIEIGGKMYTCPVHSVSYSVGTFYVPVAVDFATSWRREAVRLNDVVFSNYSVFRSSGTKWSGDAKQHLALKDLQRMVAANMGKPDAKVARQLSDLELTESVRYVELESLKEKVPGPKSRSALIALADASAFLDPAASDVSPNAPPDFDAQQRIIALAVGYVGKTLPKLPDFFSTESILRYDGNPRSDSSTTGAILDDLTWRQAGSSEAVVTYRSGKELINPREWGKHPSHAEGEGLITRGIFGPILSTVISDAAHGEMIWDRWERGPAANFAVFHYQVPQSQSHYAVAYHFRGKGQEEQPTGYHGEVAIDPASGTILILTVQADLPMGSPILRGDIMVEYGPVKIGGETYTCPVRAVSMAVDASGLMWGLGPYNLLNELPHPPVALLNDTTFSGYHLFRSNSRILKAAPEPEH